MSFSCEAFQAALSWLLGMEETQGALKDGSYLTWGSAGPYADPTPAALQNDKKATR